MDTNPQLWNRIVIMGQSGAGKSTLARKLSTLLGIQHVEMDAIFWKPNWVMTPVDEMRPIVDERLPPNGRWIIDGNYRKFADITWARAELIIWLDYPLLFVLWRLFLRCIWRIWTKERVCGENYEGLKAILSPSIDDNVLLMSLKQRGIHMTEYPKMFKEYGDGKVVVVFKHECECEAWLKQLQVNIESKSEGKHI